MKHKILLLNFFLITVISKTQIIDYGGILVGINATQIDGDTYGGYNKVGLQLGGFINKKFNVKINQKVSDFALQMALLFSQKGSKFVSDDHTQVYQISLNYIDIPFLLQYYYIFTYPFNITMELGLVPAILISSREEDEGGEFKNIKKFKPLELSSCIGFSGEFNDNILLHIRYQYSLTRIRYNNKPSNYYSRGGQFNNIVSLALAFKL